MSNVNGPATLALIDQIKHWSGYDTGVEWFYARDGRSAVAIGDGFVWSLDDDGSINEVPLGDWETGVTI